MDPVICPQCGTEMKKGKKTESSLGLQLVGVILFLVACVMLLAFPIGTVLGIVLMIVAARMGYKRVKGWKCPNCGYFFERA